ncbi:MAG TPA: SRPBCC domain-containing protein [Myxococcaceae bacterium]|nr:SRPBCC domain-containing protein [Myxococcaceae bacterium]
MITLQTEHFIAAPPSEVWAVLADFASYGEWNPFMTDARGTAAVGGTLVCTVRAVDGSGKTYRMRGRILECDPPRALSWRGGTWPLLTGRHYFRLLPREGGTRLIHGEEFRGLYPWWVGPERVETFRPKYEGINRALAARVLAGGGGD